MEGKDHEDVATVVSPIVYVCSSTYKWESFWDLFPFECWKLKQFLSTTGVIFKFLCGKQDLHFL